MLNKKGGGTLDRMKSKLSAAKEAKKSPDKPKLPVMGGAKKVVSGIKPNAI